MINQGNLKILFPNPCPQSLWVGRPRSLENWTQNWVRTVCEPASWYLKGILLMVSEKRNDEEIKWEKNICVIISISTNT